MTRQGGQGRNVGLRVQIPSRSPIGGLRRVRASRRFRTLRRRSRRGFLYVRFNDRIRGELFEMVRSDFVARFVEAPKAPDAGGSEIRRPGIGVGERHMSARWRGPRLGRERLRNGGIQCESTRNENPCTAWISAVSSTWHEPLLMTTDQEVGDSSSSGRAAETLVLGGVSPCCWCSRAAAPS